jgi:hypothetical protein
MPVDTPTTEPELVYAGQTVEWTRSLSDYPATSYALKYYLTGPASITLTAAAYNTLDHKISVTSATSAAWIYGIYTWTAYAEAGAGATAEKWFIGTGFLTVKTAAGKSFAKTMVDAIESILSGSATSKDLDLVSKSLGGVSLSRDREKLVKWRDKYRSEYQSEIDAENRLQGKSTNSKIRVRFKSV